MTSLHVVSPSRLVKTTTSRCPRCLGEIPADVRETDGVITMVKNCPEHGRFESILAGDERFYHPSIGARGGGCGAACACGVSSRTGADPFETLSTCVALIEIVDSCNLACPTCYASSPQATGAGVACASQADIRRRAEGVIDRKGAIDILQLSGGEPTIHPEFLAVLDWAVAHDGIGYVMINTNGVRIAAEPSFRDALGARRRAGAGFELYLQYDGPQAAGQRALRGADLREMKRRALDEAGAAGVPATLAMVVTRDTLAHLGDALRFGLERPHCRGVTFQPVFGSGRVPAIEGSLATRVHRPIGVGDVILALAEQAPELLSADDFTPLPCGDPNCHTIGYLLRTDAGVEPLSRLLDLPALQQFLGDRLDYRLDDLARCGCETEPLGALLKAMEIGPDRPFRIFIKPFMDAWTFDQDRIDRCCTHVIRPDGRLDSFCRHYLNQGLDGGPARVPA